MPKLFSRLPRPWRRRRPVIVPAAPVLEPVAVVVAEPVFHGRRSADVRPGGLPVLGLVHRAPEPDGGRHRAPERPVTVVFVGDDDYPTVPIRLDRADTAPIRVPRQLLAAFVPVPAAVGAR